MACGTGSVFQSAKFVIAIGPILGLGGGCANALVFRALLASNSVWTVALGSTCVVIMPNWIVGSALMRLRLIAPGSK